MTLREKLKPSTSINTQGEAGRFADESIILVNEFAIGFAEFSINYNYHPMHKVWIRYDKMINEKFTTKQLLKIYESNNRI